MAFILCNDYLEQLLTTSPHNSSMIHPTSIIDADCKFADSVHIGPYCVIGSGVRIGANTRLLSSVTILKSTTIGEDCTIYPNAVLGGPAQVHQDDPTKAALLIGNGVTIREGVTIHLGTSGKDKPTRIGNDCYLMANAHVAHDCQVADNVTLVQGVGLAGFSEVRKGAIVSGLAGVHQHVRVGEYSFVGGGAIATHDVLPYTMVIGDRAKTTGLNVVGLKRLGWTDARISNYEAAVMNYFRTGKVQSKEDSEEMRLLTDSVQNTKRGICFPAASFQKKSSKI